MLQVGHLRAELEGQCMLHSLYIAQHESSLGSKANNCPPPPKKGVKDDTFSNSAGKLKIMGKSV